MLEQVDLSLSLSKRAFKQIMHVQVQRIYELAHQVFEQETAVIILFEGWDAAGKGTAIRALSERLDPRGFKVLPTQAPRTHERQKPWLWRFWMQIPRHGQMAIFDRSWYGRVLIERVNGLTPIPDWIRAYEEINAFERTLTDDNTVLIKFWLHISREEQLRRYIALTEEPDTAWQVTAEDWENHRKYSEYAAAVSDMLANTDTDDAPWTVVPATDMNYKTYHVFRTIIERLEAALGIEPTEWQDLETLEAAAEAKYQAKKRKKLAKAEAKAEAKAAEAEARAEERREADADLAASTQTSELPDEISGDGERRGYVDGIDPDFTSFEPGHGSETSELAADERSDEASSALTDDAEAGEGAGKPEESAHHA